MILGLSGPDMFWISFAAFTAGLVRGFTGFGTAMIYLPVAGQILSPFGAITTLVIMDIAAPLPILPRAWRDGDPKDVARLGVGLVVAMPLGIFALTLVEPEVFRYGVSIVAFFLLACLIGGIRYHGVLTRPLVFGTGAMSGFLAGSVGLAGPPVILLYMASARAVKTIRANTLMFLVLTDIALLPMLALFGRLEGSSILLGLAMIIPAAIGNITGAMLFRPGKERLYRNAAYLVIGVSALSGLPIWD